MLIYLLFCTFAPSLWVKELNWSVLPSWLRIVCQCFVERPLRACSQIFKGTRCWKIEKPKRFLKAFCPVPMKWSELMQRRCYLFHAYLSCILRRFGNPCWDSAFLAYIQEEKIEKEDKVENVLGFIFCKKENTTESNNECTNPLLILLFHMNNCPEDGVLQWMEEPAVSASVSGYASIFLHKIKRKYLTSHAVSFVKLVFLKCRLEGLLVLYVLSCPSLIFLLSWRVLSLIVNWQSMYMS